MTLTIIKTITNRIFGGFTTIPMESPSSEIPKTDTHSFLYSVDERTKYPIIKNIDRAIRMSSSYCILFGTGTDIGLSSNSNQNTDSWVSNNGSYDIKGSYVLTGGSSNF